MRSFPWVAAPSAGGTVAIRSRVKSFRDLPPVNTILVPSGEKLKLASATANTIGF